MTHTHVISGTPATAGGSISTTQAQTRYARISIIGGGVTGGAVLNQAIRHYISCLKDNASLPPLRIDFFEAGGQFAYGVPYDLSSPVFRLNQPAYNMSLYDNDPSSFLAWLQRYEESKDIKDIQAARTKVTELENGGMTDAQIAYKHPDEYYMAKCWGVNDFVPRGFFRRYLQDEYRQHLDRVQQINTQLGRNQIVIAPHDVWVDDIDLSESGSIRISGHETQDIEATMNITSDAIVFATGHLQNGLLAEHRQNPDYADTPFDMKEIRTMLGDLGADGTVFIVGTSQSMLDALAALDALEFKGKIIASSGTAVEPWCYDPAKHQEKRKDYPLKYATNEAIARLLEEHWDDVERIADGLRCLIRDELHDPSAIEQGGGHVLNTLRAFEDSWRTMMSPCPGLFEKCYGLIGQFSGNSTYDGRFESYMKFKQSGQLVIERGQVKPEQTRALPDGGFEVVIYDRVEKCHNTFPVSKIVNCAAMQREPVVRDRKSGDVRAVHPLADTALRKQFIEADMDARKLVPHRDRPDGQVHIVGPAQGAGWGVPYTRSGFGDAARQAVDYAIAAQAGPAAELSL